MKKMSFTKSKWLMSFGQSLGLVLFFCCFTALQSINAQAIVMPNAKALSKVKLDECGGDVTSDDRRFTDDGANDGNYADPAGKPRTDTVEICPKDKWHTVKVVFTAFDLAKGDTLFAFQGNAAALNAAGLAAASAATLPAGAMLPAKVTAGAIQAVVSGGTSEAARKAAQSAGFFAFLPSAIQLQELIDAFLAVLNPSELPGTTGASEGTGSGAGVGSTALASARGGSVSDAFGGWIDADCNPRVNPTGCLTFVFKTNGDRAKGAGWDAWVDCGSRSLTVETVNIPSRKLTCDSAAYGIITIPAPTVKFCDSTATQTADDSVRLVVTNQHGVVCIDSCITKAGMNNGVTDTFAIGSYKATYTLKSDTEKTSTSIFSVQAPSLVCNDNINVPLGSACMIVLTPDDLLEQPCDTIHDTMYYNITITLGAGKDKKVLTTTNVDDADKKVAYPVITTADLKAAGMTVCNATATVKIERIYYGTTDTLTFCNNGAKSTSCETTINFSDQSIPWVNLKPGIDTLIACDTSGLAALIDVNAIDNCDDDVAVTYTVTMQENDPCFASAGKADTTTATVVFSAVDDCGNVGTLSKVYTVIRPNEKDHIEKTKDVSVECDATDNKATLPKLMTGVLDKGKFVKKGTVALNEDTYVCGYILTKREVEIPANDCGKKKFVYWSILDWCNSEQGPTAVDTTFIQYTDTKAPTFNAGEGATTTLELGHFSCTYDITKLDAPKASDNCSTPTVVLGEIARIEEGKTDWKIDAADWTKLDCDSFQLTWYASDDCHEQTKQDTLKQIVVIKDVTKPSAVTVDQLNISLPNEWGARVKASDVDAGSYDACGIESIQIRIKGSGDAWADYVDIGCKYVHPDLQIELRVVDKKGNENIAWCDVVVEDKIRPICEAPADATADCDKFHNGELGASTDADGDRKMEASEWTNTDAALKAKHDAYFKAFKCEDNLKSEECGDLTTEEQYQLIEWPCGEIEIKRRHRATDWSGNVSDWVEQKISITYKAGWAFTIPADWEGECGAELIAPALTINNGACDLLGYEVTSKLFEVPGDACFKMERTYHIINWCKYQAGQDPVELARVEGEHGFVAEGKTITSEGNEDKGYFTYVQILKVHDNEGPVVTVVDPTPCINGVDFDAEPYGEEDITPGVGPYECDEAKTWTASATDCSDQSVITWEGKLMDANGNVVATSKTNSITFVVTNKASYTAEFWAYDGCGNSGGKKGETIKFWDCKKPTPYVLNGVAVELGETGSIQVWATDLDRGTFDNCTDQSKLDLKIWHEDLGDAPTTLEGVQALPKVITLGCTRVGTQAVQIYAIDEEGNWDYAQTYVIVQDNMGACTQVNEGGMVAGRIVDGNGENVQSVSIAVNGADEKSMTTSADGHYQFVLPMGGDYTITPEKDMNPLNGVSTFDLVLISKHILGISQFDTPYKYIAADVNKSGSITAFDMVQLRQLILNITSEFPNNDSWRFVEGGYEFTSANPAAESFNEFMSINNLSADMPNMDFTAVKIGDVNGNALSNSLLGAESRTTNGTLNLNVTDRFVEAGQAVTVEFTSANIANATGYQFTLTTAGTAEVVEGVAKAANFNTNLAERGVIATSWNGEATANDVLFALTFTANTTGLLSEMLAITSDVTAAEAYNTDGELLNVSIDFNSAATAAGFGLNQNTPNPFTDVTTIGFNLPAAGTATLTVMDVQGKVLRAIKADYAKGYNTVSLNANELGATGVLYYQLESADNVATKKMIIIE